MIGGKHCGIDRKKRIISVLCFFCGPWKFCVECNIENIKSQWPHILFLINFYHKKLIKLHYFPEFSQTYFHWVGDAIQPSYPLSSSSPPAFNLSQHQGLFQWVGSLHQVAKVMKLQLQLQSFQWIVRVDFLSDWLVGSPCCPRDSQESSPVPQYEGISSSALSLFYCPALTSAHNYWRNHSFNYVDICQQSNVSAF